MNVLTRLLGPTRACACSIAAIWTRSCDLLARDPVDNVFVGSRVEAAGLDPWRLGGEMWGHVADGKLDVAVLLRGEPGPGQRRPRRPCAPSPSAPAGRAAAAPRSSGRAEAALNCGRSQPALGAGPRGPASQPLMAIRGPSADGGARLPGPGR